MMRQPELHVPHSNNAAVACSRDTNMCVGDLGSFQT